MISIKFSLAEKKIFKSPQLKAAHTKRVKATISAVKQKVPNHTSEDIKNHWKTYKYKIWKAQGEKCCFCDKAINEPESHLEHYRPKTEVRDDQNNILTRESYYWLAYSFENFLVSCPTCNRRKGNEFPLLIEKDREKDSNVKLSKTGGLGKEVPLLINPRFDDDVEIQFSYDHKRHAGKDILYIVPSDDCGDKAKPSIRIFDLNREATNEKEFRDSLTTKRGLHYVQFRKELREYIQKRDACLSAIKIFDSNDAEDKVLVKEMKGKIRKIRGNLVLKYFSVDSEFVGVCRWCENMDFPDEELSLG